jgi:RNase P/RNase MRP subunit POP5
MKVIGLYDLKNVFGQIYSMVKAAALKKRYVLFEYSGPDFSKEELKRAIYSEALKFFGEYGLSYAALKLMEYDQVKKRGILRCERSHLEKVLGFLALVDSLDSKPARLIALKSSGTMKSLAP